MSREMVMEMITVAATCLMACSIFVMGAIGVPTVPTDSETRTVTLSSHEWSEAKKEMDRNGIVRFDECNIVLMVTNGLRNAECWLFDRRPSISSKGYGHNAPYKEPVGYVGQTTH